MYLGFEKYFLKLEDPKQSLLNPNLWLLKYTGQLQGNNKLITYAWNCIHEIVLLFVLSQYLELWFIRSDRHSVLENLKVSMLSTVCVVKANSFVFRQKTWKEVIDYVNKADMEDRTSKNASIKCIVNEYTKYCRKITYSYWFLLVITFVSTIFQPLVLYMSSNEYRTKYRAGLAPFPHIFSSWIPWEKNEPPGCWYTVAFHAILTFYGASNMASYDSFVVVIMTFFKGKLQTLRVRCGQIFESDNRDEALEQIKECHETHVRLMKYSRMFNSVNSPTMFIYVIMSSFMICASINQLKSSISPAHMMVTAEYVIFGIAQLFMFCWHSNTVIYQSQDLMYGTFESKWWQVDVQLRKFILMLTGQLNRHVIFTAGPFTNLTIPTFLAILKGAYSYYTLLRKQ